MQIRGAGDDAHGVGWKTQIDQHPGWDGTDVEVGQHQTVARLRHRFQLEDACRDDAGGHVLGGAHLGARLAECAHQVVERRVQRGVVAQPTKRDLHPPALTGCRNRTSFS